MGEDDERQTGRGTGRLGRWLRRGEGARAAKQQADPGALAVEGDPRGGLQSDDYRSADPREVVQEGDVVMSGPAGAPQEGLTPEERRESADARRGDADAREP